MGSCTSAPSIDIMALQVTKTKRSRLGTADQAFRTDRLSLVPASQTGKVFLDKDGATHRSLAPQNITLKLLNSDEEIVVPGVVATTVGEVREMLVNFTGCSEHQLKIVRKVGGYYRQALYPQQIGAKAYISGIKSFRPMKKKWKNPIGIIGTGYNGLKVAMTYVMDGDDHFVMFDRNDKVGGYCWITAANKTSRLQSEMGSFHLWYGQHCVNSGKMDYPDCNRQMNWMCTEAKSHDPLKTGWSVWPYKWEIQQHFHECVEKFGILPNIKFRTNVFDLSTVAPKSYETLGGKSDWEGRHYTLSIESLDSDRKHSEVNVDVIYHFPGSMTRNRIIDYPGGNQSHYQHHHMYHQHHHRRPICGVTGRERVS